MFKRNRITIYYPMSGVLETDSNTRVVFINTSSDKLAEFHRSPAYTKQQFSVTRLLRRISAILVGYKRNLDQYLDVI